MIVFVLLLLLLSLLLSKAFKRKGKPIKASPQAGRYSTLTLTVK